MKLLVDIGNTRIKWATEINSVLGLQGAFQYRYTELSELFDEHWKSAPLPEQVLVSCVAGEDVRDALTGWVAETWNVKTRTAKVERCACGVTNGYHDIEQLGVDRWLAVIAAWNRFKSPLCVADCGTAITIDGINSDGQHQGGLIIPGLAMMQGALNRETCGIEVENTNGIALEFGRDTQTGISNGCSFAAVALIDRVVKKMHAEMGDELTYVITGGAAQQFSPFLANNFLIEPQLVLYGLSRLFRGQP